MQRFGCIGPRCEENCCQDGWRIDVNRDGYKRLLAATQFAPRDIARRVQAAIRVVPAKTKKAQETYVIKQDASGACPLFDDGWCAIHSNFGLDMLPHVCAIYPRKLVRVTDRYELSATASCPEVARQILLHADAVDVVGFDPTTLNRIVLQEGLDIRDTRPFYRALTDVRGAMMDLARDTSLPLSHRLFLMLWFAHRTSDLLNKQRISGDLGAVVRELALLRIPKARDTILARFEELETPAAVAVYIARGIVRPKLTGVIRPRWNGLVNAVVESFAPLQAILPSSTDEAVHDRAAATPFDAGQQASAEEVKRIYTERRDRLRSVPEVRDRIDGFFTNYVIHTWFHRFPTDEASLLDYVLRMLAQQACQKLMVYGHPDLVTALDRFDTEAVDDRSAAIARLLEQVDAIAVAVFYMLARHIEHGQLLTWLVTHLKERQIATIAGGIHLIRF
jgi:hypothetical protein